MKACIKIVFFTLLILMSSITTYARDYKSSIIANPSISRRCKFVAKERQDKMRHKQKIMELITRNQMLVRKTPPHKKTLLSKLKVSFNRLRHELRLTLIKITRMEENIVRKGCPSVKF